LNSGSRYEESPGARHDPLFNDIKSNNIYFTDFIKIVQKAQFKKSALREKLRELENDKDAF